LKSIIIAHTLIVLTTICLFSCSTKPESPRLENGDIIFHESTSAQSLAIQLATNSRYSHLGILYKRGNAWYVFEAIQPVKLTPLKQWIKRGKNGHYVVKRLKESRTILTASALAKMQDLGEKYAGKSYDLYFEWSDERIYCSELVWKLYKEAFNIEVGQLEKLKDFKLDHPQVRAKLTERYGDSLPLDETVISPAAMFNSHLLYTIISSQPN